MTAQGESTHSPEIQWQTAQERWVRPSINPEAVRPPQSSRQSLKDLIQTTQESPRYISPEERDAREKLAAIVRIGEYIEDDLRVIAQTDGAIPVRQPYPGEVIPVDQFSAPSDQQGYAREVFDVEAA